MKAQLTYKNLGFTLALVFGALLFSAAPVFAEEHEEHMDDEMHQAIEVVMVEVTAGSDRIEQMKSLINLLTQLLEVMEQKVVMQQSMHTEEHEDDMHDMDDMHEESEELVISVELHNEQTHIHVDYADETEDVMFYVEANIHDPEAVYDAIVAETGLDREEVVAATSFDHATHEHGEHEGEEMDGSNADMDLTGIHIMPDGSVMLGNGVTLTDATVNDEGMIVLGDGTEVEPLMDMR